jgi:hypothetical protein
MMKVLAAISILIGGLLAYRGFSVWNHCGYDCRIGLGWIGLDATAAMLFGIIVFGFGVVALTAMFLGDRQGNG